MHMLDRHDLHLVNSFGLVALQAAYDHGEEWLDQVLSYTEANLDYLKQYLREHIPQILLAGRGQLLQPVHRRVLAVHVIADRCGRHGGAHRLGGQRRGVAAQIDNALSHPLSPVTAAGRLDVRSRPRLHYTAAPEMVRGPQT